MVAIMFTSSIILLREGLEAVLILSILWAISKQYGSKEISKSLKFGAITALVLSIMLGGALYILIGKFEGIGAYLFEGLMSLMAATVVTYVVLWMTKYAPKLKNILKEKIDEAISIGKNNLTIFSIAFVVVIREGIEAVLLLGALMSISIAEVTTGIILGFILLGIISFAIFYLGIRIPLKTFFRATSIFLIIIAAGLVGYGIHELIEAAEASGIKLGILAKPAWDINWMLHEKSMVGTFLKGLIGYDGNPEILRVIVQSGYLVIAGAYLYKYMFKIKEI